MKNKSEHELAAARRNFLKSCGKYAAITPPVVTLMLSAASHNYAAAQSGFATPRQGNNGFGNGGGDGVPGNSGNNPAPNSGQKADDEVR